MKVFLGIFLVSGYSGCKRRRLYWSGEGDVRNKVIANAMARDRFDEIMRYFHIADNSTLDQADKFYKVRPLMSMLNSRFQKHFLCGRDLSVDESMVPYFGKHEAKQFIRGKPIHYGYKIWVLATPLRYVVNMVPYQGATGEKRKPGLGMGGEVVLDSVSVLPQKPFHITFDNLFSSVTLVEELAAKGLACTGTIRANRISDCPLIDIRHIEKQPRVTYDHKCDNSRGVVMARWNDNSVVTVISNFYGVEPIQPANRWSQKEGKRINIPQPYAIKQYNRTIGEGGVDRLYQNVEDYRSGIRSKKWWWPLMLYCLDVTVQQAWHLYRVLPESLVFPKDLLCVRREIAKVWLMKLQKLTTTKRGGKYPAIDKRVSPKIRFDRQDHWIEPIEKQARCASCGIKTRQRCIKCGVDLHDRCFIVFYVSSQ